MRPPESWRRARVTLVLAAVTAAAWLLASSLGWQNAVVNLGGFVPADVQGGPSILIFLTPLTATLVHGGFPHLAFNLLILLFCGRSVENIIGPLCLVVLYVVGAYLAAAVHYLTGPQDLTPMIGASGAISAVLGAYAMLFGRNRVKIADPRLALWVNALWLAAAWIGLQLLVGLTFETAGARIAVGAHIGGFLTGLVLTKPLLLLRWRGA